MDPQALRQRGAGSGLETLHKCCGDGTAYCRRLRAEGQAETLGVARHHVARGGSAARKLWSLMEIGSGDRKRRALPYTLVVPQGKGECSRKTPSNGKRGGQGRNRTADASLFRAALYQLSYLANSFHCIRPTNFREQRTHRAKAPETGRAYERIGAA